MPKSKQLFYILLTLIFINVLGFQVIVSAKPAIQEIVFSPEINNVKMLSFEGKLTLTAMAFGVKLKYLWEIEGPGSFEGSIHDNTVVYISPKKWTNEKTIVKVTVTDAQRETAIKGIEMIFPPPPEIVSEEYVTSLKAAVQELKDETRKLQGDAEAEKQQELDKKEQEFKNQRVQAEKNLQLLRDEFAQKEKVLHNRNIELASQIAQKEKELKDLQAEFSAKENDFQETTQQLQPEIQRSQQELQTLTTEFEQKENKLKKELAEITTEKSQLQEQLTQLQQESPQNDEEREKISAELFQVQKDLSAARIDLERQQKEAEEQQKVFKEQLTQKEQDKQKIRMLEEKLETINKELNNQEEILRKVFYIRNIDIKNFQNEIIDADEKNRYSISVNETVTIMVELLNPSNYSFNIVWEAENGTISSASDSEKMNNAYTAITPGQGSVSLTVWRHDTRERLTERIQFIIRQ